MTKLLLPFSLYEELENIDQLKPEELSSFLKSLQRYCESTRNDFNKACKDLGIEIPPWAEVLTSRQVEVLDKACKKSRWASSYDKASEWTLNKETGKVDISGDFKGANCFSGDLMGIKFGVSKNGYFDISSNNLSSLEGSPDEVDGSFNCRNNDGLEDLKGCPTIVHTIDASNCKNLSSLEGSPTECSSFDVRSCPNLSSLKGGPKIVHSFNCESAGIFSLEGGPEEISNKQGVMTTYKISNCRNLSSLEGAPQKIERTDRFYMTIHECPSLYSLEGLPLDDSIRGGNLDLEKNGLKSLVLKRAYAVAAETKSWVVAYLSMFTDAEFIKTGKAPKEPIRAKLAPANIKKEVEENGERFVVGLKSIWTDFRVKKILKEIEMPEDTKADADMLSALDDIGL